MKSNQFTAGLDEAGRGPLAGPVSASCVILPPDFPFEILNDSKKLSEKKRDEAFAIITEKACWGLALVDNKKIDEINILNASLLAMKLAWENMLSKLDDFVQKNNLVWNGDLSDIHCIADGLYVPQIASPCEAVVKADAKFCEVMAASIVAKVSRDRLMGQYAKKYPQYGYEKHKGYPTLEHKKICRQIGPSPIQRLSFKY